MTDIVWKEPREAQRSSAPGVWTPILAPLIEQPKRWAVVRTTRTVQAAVSAAFNLRHHKVKRPPGNWEFVARDREVYARYLGPEDES